jgi:hypothetical protein
VDAADIFAMSSALADLESYKSTTGFNDAYVVALGDFDGDRVVTNADLQGLINFLANGGGSTSPAAVPEPASAILFTLGSAAGVFVRLVRRKKWTNSATHYHPTQRGVLTVRGARPFRHVDSTTLLELLWRNLPKVGR